MRALTIAAGLFIFAELAAAGGIPPGTGVDAPAGARFSSALEPAGDVDDFVIPGISGQTVRLKLRTGRKSTLTPVLQLIGPDDTIVAVGLGRRPSLRQTLDVTGAWTVRVIGDDPATTGAYRLDVKYGAPPRVDLRLEDENTEGRFSETFVAGPLSRVDLALRFNGSAPEISSVTDPSGREIPGLDLAIRERRRRLDVSGLEIPRDFAFGEYEAVFDSNPLSPPTKVRFSARVSPPELKGRKRRRQLSADEPRITFTPFSAPIATEFTFGVENAFDAASGDTPPTVFLGEQEVELSGASDTSVVAYSRPGVRLGEHLAHVRTATGQWATGAAPILFANPPQFSDQSTRTVPSVGGVELSLPGTSLPSAENVELLLDLFSVGDLEVLEAREDLLRILAPPHVPGLVAVNLRDASTRLVTAPQTLNFNYVPTPQIDAVLPGVVPELGGEEIELPGIEYAPDDRVLLESSTPGVFEELSAAQTTFVSSVLHRFTAPVRPAGRYEIVIESAAGDRDIERSEITYFDLVDATTAFGLDAVLGDSLDAATLDVADYDGDGWDDLFLARASGAVAASTTQTRVLRNDEGSLVDVTADVIPDLPAGEDWSAKRLRVDDVTGDGRPDIVLLTDSPTVPVAGRSRVRILENVASATAPGGRAFEDVTVDLMAPPREMQNFRDTDSHVADDWSGVDLWIGDLDGDGGRPNLVVTGEAPLADLDVFGGQYAESDLGAGVIYRFYWPATRVFEWDAAARAGEGAFRFDRDRLPRTQGVIVSILGVPPGVKLWVCNEAVQCEHAITPFAGTSLVVEDLDGDGKKDIAVVSPEEVLRRPWTGEDLQTVSSLQVALNRPGMHTLKEFPTTDITEQLTALGLFRGDTLAAGQPERGGQNAVLAVSDRTAGRNPALRLVRLNPFIDVDPPEFEDLSPDVVPNTVGGEEWQAMRMSFRDIDRDGRDDLMLLASSPPGGSGSALRLLRSRPATAGPGWRLEQAYADLFDDVTGTSEHLDGDAFAIGDLDRDGLPEFLISRTTTTGATTETRAVRMTADD